MKVGIALVSFGPQEKHPTSLLRSDLSWTFPCAELERLGALHHGTIKNGFSTRRHDMNGSQRRLLLLRGYITPFDFAKLNLPVQKMITMLAITAVNIAYIYKVLANTDASIPSR